MINLEKAKYSVFYNGVEENAYMLDYNEAVDFKNKIIDEDELTNEDSLEIEIVTFMTFNAKVSIFSNNQEKFNDSELWEMINEYVESYIQESLLKKDLRIGINLFTLFQEAKNIISIKKEDIENKKYKLINDTFILEKDIDLGDGFIVSKIDIEISNIDIE